VRKAHHGRPAADDRLRRRQHRHDTYSGFGLTVADPIPLGCDGAKVPNHKPVRFERERLGALLGMRRDEDCAMALAAPEPQSTSASIAALGISSSGGTNQGGY
jgi:hypothetical protein